MKQHLNLQYNQAGQRLDVFLPDGPFEKVFLFFHGGGLVNGTKDYQPFMGYLADHGMAVVSAAYRLYPEARYPDFIEDAADAVKWVKTNLADKQLYVGGSSAGGYLSMMLCFDGKYLQRRDLKVTDIQGFVHNAGQPTTHFSVLEERGLDSRRVIVDEAAPLYHIGTDAAYPPMLFLVSDNDIPCRLEQTQLVLSTMKHFDCGDSARLQILKGYHVAHDNAFDPDGESIFGKLILEFAHDPQGSFRTAP